MIIIVFISSRLRIWRHQRWWRRRRGRPASLRKTIGTVGTDTAVGRGTVGTGRTVGRLHRCYRMTVSVVAIVVGKRKAAMSTEWRSARRPSSDRCMERRQSNDRCIEQRTGRQIDLRSTMRRQPDWASKSYRGKVEPGTGKPSTESDKQRRPTVV